MEDDRQDQDVNTPAFYVIARPDRAAEAVTAGDVVYRYAGCDYGLAKHDSRAKGIRCTSVTLNPTGDIPFFTVPLDDLTACATS